MPGTRRRRRADGAAARSRQFNEGGTGGIGPGAGTLTEARGNSTSLASVTSGSDGLIKQGTGTLTGTNGFSGGTRLQAGTPEIGTPDGTGRRAAPGGRNGHRNLSGLASEDQTRLVRPDDGIPPAGRRGDVMDGTIRSLRSSAGSGVESATVHLSRFN